MQTQSLCYLKCFRHASNLAVTSTSCHIPIIIGEPCVDHCGTFPRHLYFGLALVVYIFLIPCPHYSAIASNSTINIGFSALSAPTPPPEPHLRSYHGVSTRPTPAAPLMLWCSRTKRRGDGEMNTTDVCSPRRPSTPPPPPSTMEFGHPTPLPPPSTPGSGKATGSNIIMESTHATVPPSPGGGSFPAFNPFTVMPSDQDPPVPKGIRKAKGKQGASTGAGVKKARAKKKTDGALAKLVTATSAKKSLEVPFRFMDLPGGEFPLSHLCFMNTADKN